MLRHTGLYMLGLLCGGAMFLGACSQQPTQAPTALQKAVNDCKAELAQEQATQNSYYRNRLYSNDSNHTAVPPDPTPPPAMPASVQDCMQRWEGKAP